MPSNLPARYCPYERCKMKKMAITHDWLSEYCTYYCTNCGTQEPETKWVTQSEWIPYPECWVEEESPEYIAAKILLDKGGLCQEKTKLEISRELQKNEMDKKQPTDGNMKFCVNEECKKGGGKGMLYIRLNTDRNLQYYCRTCRIVY